MIRVQGDWWNALWGIELSRSVLIFSSMKRVATGIICPVLSENRNNHNENNITLILSLVEFSITPFR